MNKIFITKNQNQTKNLGQKIAKDLLKKYKKNDSALVLGLTGELGGGKTTFLQGFAKGLGIKNRILSPTFIILRKLEIKNKKIKFKNFYHIDCYRIKKAKDILDLGFEEIISNNKNIIAIEWANIIKKVMPPKSIWIKFEVINEQTRKITIKY